MRQLDERGVKGDAFPAPGYGRDGIYALQRQGGSALGISFDQVIGRNRRSVLPSRQEPAFEVEQEIALSIDPLLVNA